MSASRAREKAEISQFKNSTDTIMNSIKIKLDNKMWMIVLYEYMTG